MKISCGVPSVAQRRSLMVIEIVRKGKVWGSEEGPRVRELAVELLYWAIRLYDVTERELSREERTELKDLRNASVVRYEIGDFIKDDFTQLCQRVVQMKILAIEELRSIIKKAERQANRERQEGKIEHWPL